MSSPFNTPLRATKVKHLVGPQNMNFKGNIQFRMYLFYMLTVSGAPKEIDRAIRKMDKAYNTHFHQWVKDDSNIEYTSARIRRLLVNYPLGKVVNGLKWITAGWSPEKRGELLWKVTRSWSKSKQLLLMSALRSDGSGLEERWLFTPAKSSSLLSSKQPSASWVSPNCGSCSATGDVAHRDSLIPSEDLVLYCNSLSSVNQQLLSDLSV